ncbi:hypothetical protein PV325_002332 [Microctonus aethiopoides]|nr:hypothetical protein PV325_002332 [Microctonus aethiopoides]KAK0092473.1 hypothetical protein PV326_001331 [Microctonus aethiopoides]
MSDKDIKIEHKGRLIYNGDRYGNYDFSTTKDYLNSFESNLIPDVKFEIMCYVSTSKLCYVILSKTRETPVNATIAIEFIGIQKIERIVHVDRWTNYCTFKINIGTLLQGNTGSYGTYGITIRCNITWHASKKPKLQVLDSLYDRFKNFLTVPDLSDMTIVIDEKEIPVHKIVLAVYSPVFLAMFKADMTESVNKRIVVTDIEVDIMEKVIEFMYTSVIDPIPEFNDLLSILEVADKYQIMNLKELCKELLSENITIDNVLKILERASLCGVPQLMETLISFMVKEKLKIVELEDFADLYRRKPELLFKFVILIVKN